MIAILIVLTVLLAPVIIGIINDAERGRMEYERRAKMTQSEIDEEDRDSILSSYSDY